MPRTNSDSDLVNRARLAVRREVKAGRLVRLDGSVPCVDCGHPAREYDHRDYKKPLDVAPVCRSCNARRGTALNRDDYSIGNRTRIIAINRWAIRGEPELCEYVKTQAIRSERNVRQQMIYMLKLAMKVEKEEHNDK